jgi:hypothetical protein
MFLFRRLLTDLILFEATYLFGFPYKYECWAKNGYSSLRATSLLGEKHKHRSMLDEHCILESDAV